MSEPQMISLEELMAKRAGSVNPSKFPDEQFDLYSIPAFDKGCHEVVTGSEIGSTKQLVEPNDVLLSKIVPHIRRSWVVGQNNGRRMIASGEWIVFRSKKTDPAYLRHVLIGDPFHSQFMQTVSGVGGSLLRARPAHVAKIKIPLPSLPEQRRISAILDKADVLRAKRREALAHLNILTQSIFFEMFGEPARNTKNLPLITLGDIGKWQSGGTPPRTHAAYFLGSIPWFSSGELQSMYVSDSSEKITPEALKITSAKPVPRGALMLGMYDTAALKASIAGADCSCNQAIAFASLNPELVETVFVYHAICIGREHFRRLQRGVRQKNLNLEMVRQIHIPLPPIIEQKSFVERALWINDMAKTHHYSLGQVNTLFSSLQHRAFRGEL